MANFSILLNPGNPTLTSSFSGSPLAEGRATAQGLASAPPEARYNVDHRSQYAAGMTADEARAVQGQFKNLIEGKHT